MMQDIQIDKSINRNPMTMYTKNPDSRNACMVSFTEIFCTIYILYPYFQTIMFTMSRPRGSSSMQKVDLMVSYFVT